MGTLGGSDGGLLSDGAMANSDGPITQVGPDGCTVAAPPALGVALFGDTCKTGAPPTVDWSDIRRISRIEYDNMVRDLLGDTTQPATAFVAESDMGAGVNLQTNTYGGVGQLIAQQYVLAAEGLAATAASSSANLTSVFTLNGIATCTTEDATCAQQFINGFALRAFRGHLDATESATLMGLYTAIAPQYGFLAGMQAIITGVLSSPWFLYVVELGDGTADAGTTAIPLSQYEIAARLAFFLWRTVPDIGTGSLMSAAAAGTLSSPAAVQLQAQRMLASPKALDAIHDFTTQWLELEAAPSGKDPIFTKWAADPSLGQEMTDETLTNVSQLILAENGGLTELLTSSSSYVNSNLAGFYGGTIGTGTTVTVTDPSLTASGQTTFVQTALPNRAGVMTNGSILAIQSHSLLPSSVLRGKMIREDLLCDPIGNPPPQGVPPFAATVPDGGTTRQLFQAHAEIDGTTGKTFCYACHQYMDFIAFGLGNYDATGAYQQYDQNGAATGPVLDVTGTVFPTQPGELSATFNGATDPTNGVVAKIAGSAQASECFALQEFRYSLGRLETANDVCSAQQFYTAFTGSSLNIQKLMIAIVGTNAFLYRSPNNPNGACQAGAGDAGSSCQ